MTAVSSQCLQTLASRIIKRGEGSPQWCVESALTSPENCVWKKQNISIDLFLHSQEPLHVLARRIVPVPMCQNVECYPNFPSFVSPGHALHQHCDNRQLVCDSKLSIVRSLFRSLREEQLFTSVAEFQTEGTSMRGCPWGMHYTANAVKVLRGL